MFGLAITRCIKGGERVTFFHSSKPMPCPLGIMGSCSYQVIAFNSLRTGMLLMFQLLPQSPLLAYNILYRNNPRDHGIVFIPGHGVQ